MLTWQPTQDETHPINNSVHSIMYELTRVCLCVCVHVCVYIYGNMQISLYNTNTLYVSFDCVRSKRVFCLCSFLVYQSVSEISFQYVKLLTAT